MKTNAKEPALVLGLMSGTSLDGLDMALCRFVLKGKTYRYKILKAHTIEYNTEWKKRLSHAQQLTAEEYFKTDAAYASFIAAQINRFLKSEKYLPKMIGSHGHTIFHQPESGFSTQMGSGAMIAAKTGITTVCDFRSLDVGLGGQGAPLVPIGDELLFGSYQACLNIGGIANISLRKKGKRIAYDICCANMLLNFLAQHLGMEYDRGGRIAAGGAVDKKLLARLNKNPLYKKTGPRSIGREWFEQQILPLFKNSGLPWNDQLATATAHVADIIANELKKNKIKNVLVTGGGAFNMHLIQCIEDRTSCQIIVPEKEIVMFKEALIFAFLAWMRVLEKTNTLRSVTGANADSSGGAIYYPAKG